MKYLSNLKEINSLDSKLKLFYLHLTERFKSSFIIVSDDSLLNYTFLSRKYDLKFEFEIHHVQDLYVNIVFKCLSDICEESDNLRIHENSSFFNYPLDYLLKIDECICSLDLNSNNEVKIFLNLFDYIVHDHFQKSQSYIDNLTDSFHERIFDVFKVNIIVSLFVIYVLFEFSDLEFVYSPFAFIFLVMLNKPFFEKVDKSLYYRMNKAN